MTRNWHPVPLHNRDMVDLLPGTVLSGHFVLGGPVALAADGGGLWRASDVATGQAVLVKILTARPAGDTVARGAVPPGGPGADRAVRSRDGPGA
jgi:hypothetical protein